MRQLIRSTTWRFLPWVGSLALCAFGCGGPASPTAPSQAPAPIAARFMSVEIGDVVRTQVTAADVPCDFGYYCKFFELEAPRDGTLEIGLTHAPGRIFGALGTTPIDMWVTGGRSGPVYMDAHAPDVEAYARVPATAGGTFQVGVVSYEMPGVTFQLRFLLRQ